MSTGKELIKTTSVEKQLNESIAKRNPKLFEISKDGDLFCDKQLLVEASISGYDPLDAEDLNNFLEKLPPKNQERNIILSGANQYTVLGQSEYGELDITKFQKAHKVDVVTRNNLDDLYLSDLSTEGLISKDKYFKETPEMDKLHEESKKYNLSEDELNDFYKDANSSIEEIHRTGLAKVFGSDDIKPIEEEKILSETTEVKKHDSKLEKMLELIKELKVLGFTEEEIKIELKNLR